MSLRALRRLSAWALPRPSATASAKLANSTVNHSQIASWDEAAFARGAVKMPTVVRPAPTCVTNMTGFLIISRGLSFLNESANAGPTMFQSKERESFVSHKMFNHGWTDSHGWSGATNPPVLDCGSPLPLWNPGSRWKSGRGLPQSKTLPRSFVSILCLFIRGLVRKVSLGAQGSARRSGQGQHGQEVQRADEQNCSEQQHDEGGPEARERARAGRGDFSARANRRRAMIGTIMRKRPMSIARPSVVLCPRRVGREASERAAVVTGGGTEGVKHFAKAMRAGVVQPATPHELTAARAEKPRMEMHSTSSDSIAIFTSNAPIFCRGIPACARPSARR